VFTIGLLDLVII